MNTAEIVMNGIKSDGVTKVINLFAEPVGQTRESTHGHAHREVLALNVACGDVARVGLARDNRRLRPDAGCSEIVYWRRIFCRQIVCWGGYGIECFTAPALSFEATAKTVGSGEFYDHSGGVYV